MTIANKVEAAVRSITGGTFAKVNYSIVAKPYIRKGATDGSKTVNPLWAFAGDIRCERTNVQINLGARYGKVVEAHIANTTGREDDDALYPVEPAKGKQAHAIPHKLLCQNMDRSKTYINYIPMQNKAITTRFTLNGVDVTAQLTPFMAKKAAPSAKQAAYGLAVEDQVQWRTLEAANVTSMTLLGKVID